MEHTSFAFPEEYSAEREAPFSTLRRVGSENIEGVRGGRLRVCCLATAARMKNAIFLRLRDYIEGPRTQSVHLIFHRRHHHPLFFKLIVLLT